MRLFELVLVARFLSLLGGYSFYRPWFLSRGVPDAMESHVCSSEEGEGIGSDFELKNTELWTAGSTYCVHNTGFISSPKIGFEQLML